ncbi:hypothetical protein GBA52_012205 [Prunus armeniaca]|nr:hypothetical protein GBA52_012205 [Prunus armeniaca]
MSLSIPRSSTTAACLAFQNPRIDDMVEPMTSNSSIICRILRVCRQQEQGGKIYQSVESRLMSGSSSNNAVITFSNTMETQDDK